MGWDPAGHTLQDETLAFGDNNGLGLWWVDDAGSLGSGAWRGEEKGLCVGPGWECRGIPSTLLQVAQQDAAWRAGIGIKQPEVGSILLG